MVTFDFLRKLLLSFPEVKEAPHFEKTSFRVKSRIFATYLATEDRATIKLSEIDQDVFVSHNREAIYPVANKWGKQGWTTIELKLVHPDLLVDALKTAYCTVAPENLSREVRRDELNDY